MKKVIVIGGGLAGISAAVHLREKNFDVTLIEGSPLLGGRAKSFFDKEFNCYLDNGQHLLIQGYKNTLDLIKKIEAESNFIFQNEFEVIFRDKFKREWKLKIEKSLNAFISLTRFKNLNLSEKISLIKFFSQLNKLDEQSVDKITALDFLRKLNQSENLINNFWTLIIESALNTPIEKAAASVFLFILKKMFVENKINSRLILPKKSLYESLILPAENFLIRNGVEVIKSCGIHKVSINDNRIIEIIDRDGKVYLSDYFILAVHPAVANKLIPDLDIKLDYKSIINLQLKISSDDFKNHFFALWDSIIHWAFFHENYLTIVKSSADEFISFSNEQIFQIFIDELILFFPELKIELVNIKRLRNNYRVIKEKRSTFLSDLNSISSRPTCKTKFDNLFLAGDYIDTGYPSTIESAILSGKIVAEEIN